MASKLDRLQKKGFKVNEAALNKIARGDQEPGGEYSEININDIEENPDNALYRELDTEEDIALLADDIRRAGLLHNLVVFPKTGVGGKYVLLSGERRLRALRLLVEQDKREQEEKQLPNRMSEWQKVQCKVVRNLTENEKVVYIDSANLQVRGGISNERVMRQAAARFVENLQKAPYNLSAAEAKKALKEVSPLNSRTIDKALSIQNDLNPDLRRLLDEEFLNRAECETYLRLTLEEQARAAAVFLKIAALDPRSHERRAIKDALTTAMLDVAVERRSMQERESVFAAALQNAQDAIGQAKTQENKAAIQAVSAAALAGKSVGVAITEREIRPPFPVTLFLRPRTLTLGVGCKRGTDAAHLEDCFRAFLHENGVSPLSVRAVATIDVKKDEAAILALCEKYRFPLQTYSAAELNAVPGVFAHSDFVMKTVGCGCVCERAAVMTGGRLLVGKTAMQGVTLALAGEENV